MGDFAGGDFTQVTRGTGPFPIRAYPATIEPSLNIFGSRTNLRAGASKTLAVFTGSTNVRVARAGIREGKVGQAKDQGAIAPKPSERTEIDRFLDQAAHLPRAQAPRGRLIFGFDATMSRKPTWDLAQDVQARMFETAAAHGGLAVQLAYYRGFHECRASSFVTGGKALGGLMSRIAVAAGRTQIERLLHHVRDEACRERIDAFVFIGDAMEEEIDAVAGAAAEIGLLGVKAFMFQEGRDRHAEQAFRQIAMLTGGAYAAFDLSSPEKLAGLLSAVAAYAAGGRSALEIEARDRKAGAADLLLAQMR